MTVQSAAVANQQLAITRKQPPPSLGAADAAAAAAAADAVDVPTLLFT